MRLKYGCASQSSLLVNNCCTSSPPYCPGGRLMECTTTRSTFASAGRGPKFGESSRRAKRYQPPCHSAGAAGSGRLVIRLVAAGRREREAGDAVADLPQRQSQALRRGGAVEAALLQRLDQDFALLLVEVGLQVRG